MPKGTKKARHCEPNGQRGVWNFAHESKFQNYCLYLHLTNSNLYSYEYKIIPRNQYTGYVVGDSATDKKK